MGPIEMAPAHLHHADPRVGEEVDRALQNIRVGDEVGVENEDELAAGASETGGQRARLVADARIAVDVLDVEASGGEPLRGVAGAGARVVLGVVEDLDLKRSRG